MSRTTAALYDSISDARNVVQELVDNGFPRDDISLIAQNSEGQTEGVTGQEQENIADGTATGAGIGAALGGLGGLLVGLGALTIPGVGPIIAAGPIATTLLGAGIGAVGGGVIGALVDLGMPDEEAGYFAEGIRRGGALVSVETTDERIDEAIAILRRHNPIDVRRRAERWRSEGWTRFDPNAEPYVRQETDYASRGAVTEMDETEATIPVVEEELRVGKRDVDTGVRVHSYVREQPVEEQVRLREERIDVERRPVDRPATEADLADAFEEKSVEVHATREEPVVAKQARVVEEVEIGKDVDERTETVSGTVRRTDVEVEPLASGTSTGIRSFETYEPRFRQHFTSTYGGTGNITYTQYVPAYRYGYTLATNEAYRGRDWNDFEMDARRRWEGRNPGTWERVKDAVREAWNEARAQF